jgi:hypothetical protein
MVPTGLFISVLLGTSTVLYRYPTMLSSRSVGLVTFWLLDPDTNPRNWIRIQNWWDLDHCSKVLVSGGFRLIWSFPDRFCSFKCRKARVLSCNQCPTCASAFKYLPYWSAPCFLLPTHIAGSYNAIYSQMVLVKTRMLRKRMLLPAGITTLSEALGARTGSSRMWIRR